MAIEQILFYAFSSLMLVSALMVVASKNAVRAVLFLVLTFVGAAFNWMLLETEFLSIVLILVYVGAVMVLFLFVVMMLNIEDSVQNAKYTRYLPIGVVTLLVVVGIVATMVGAENFGLEQYTVKEPRAADYSNVETLGSVLFTEYFFAFEMAGIILLVAIVAAVSLTFRGPRSRKKQDVSRQVSVKKEDRLRIVDLKSDE